jgi:hypothetical protein
MKIEIANKIETMIRNEEKHLDWLKSNNAPQELIGLYKWHVIHYTERLKLYRESLSTTQKEWKTFMIETLSQKTDVPYRFFSQYYSMEDAREHHKRAISIIEVKLNIEPVNS